MRQELPHELPQLPFHGSEMASADASFVATRTVFAAAAAADTRLVVSSVIAVFTRSVELSVMAAETRLVIVVAIKQRPKAFPPPYHPSHRREWY